MQTALGWILIIFPGILFIAQLISSINFKLAQQLGLQEDPENADPILQRAERYTAYWDLLTMGWLPITGILMLTNNQYWPYIALVAAGIYFDASGREAAKILCFKHEHLNAGSPLQQTFFFSTYIIMALLAITVLAYSLNYLL
jgi:hypothetical protein